MGVLGKYGSNALKYWGSILASAYEGASTADMWDAVHADQQRYGLPKPGASAPDVSVLRGYANRIVAGAQALAEADPGDAITADMMAIAPYTANDLNGIAVNPTYHVRYLNTVEADDGTVTTAWQTSIFTAVDMPGTVGALADAINSDASELAAQGGQSTENTPRGVSVSTSNYEITLVLPGHGRRPLPEQQRLHLDPARGDHPGHRDPGHPDLPGGTGAPLLARPR